MKKIVKVSDIVLVAMTDAAWVVRQDGSCQGEYVIMACHSKVLDGEDSDFGAVDRKSFKLTRPA
eukprot:2575125-Pyramimonas_sp.AAC.1